MSLLLSLGAKRGVCRGRTCSRLGRGWRPRHELVGWGSEAPLSCLDKEPLGGGGGWGVCTSVCCV